MSEPLILVVEDHPEMQKVIVDLLHWEAFKTLTAEDAETALALARENAPDLVMLDVSLPGKMNGLDALQAIRSDPDLTSTPVILLTAETFAARTDEADAADIVLLKPADPDDLVMLIHRLLETPAST